MACSQTGSGKTAAFLLPIIHNLLQDGVSANVGAREQSPQVIVVTPTRELANQVNILFKKVDLVHLISRIYIKPVNRPPLFSV